MTIRQRIRRLWIGRDLYDFAVLTVNHADAAESQGRAKAEQWLRDNGLAYLIKGDESGGDPA